MHVSRIEVFGFKSFMERIVLPLEGGITGVVGPNGCGKSNIVDAIRWVLGETRAKSLRGGVLEDIIFNGTDNLRPLGLAEVTITLRANQENFFADLVSPALEAELMAEAAAAETETDVEQEEDSLESEALEDSKVEGAESEELDAHSNGRPKLRVISGNLQSTDSDNKLEPIEQSLDQSAEDESEQESEKETEQVESETNNNVSASMLHRFAWLRSCNEVQVTRRLYRSGESEFFINRVQCRLRDVKELFRAVGLGPRAYTIVAQGEVARLITAKPEERRSILEEAAGVQGFRDKISASQRRLQETSVNISRIDDILKEVVRQVGSLKRQASKARNRQSLKDELKEIEAKLFRDSYVRIQQQFEDNKNQYQELLNSEKEADASFQKERSQEESARNELMSIDVAGDELRSKIDLIKDDLSQRARQRSEKLSRVSELEAFRQARETEIRRIKERAETFTSRAQECNQTLENSKAEESVLSGKVDAMDLSSADSLKELSDRLDSLRKEFKDTERTYRQSKEVLISKKSSLDSAEQQLIASSPVEQLQKSLRSGDMDSLRTLSDKARLLIDGLSVPEGYAKALQAVLAEKAAFLITDNPHELGKAFLNLAKGSNQKGLGIGVFKTVPVVAKINREVPFPSLLSLLNVEASCEGVIGKLLSGVYFSESSEEAFDFFAAATQPENLVLVTRAGEVITADSFYALRHESGVVQLKEKADSLRIEIESLEQEVDQHESRRNDLATQIEQTEKEHSVLLKDFQARQAELRELNNKLGNIRGRLHAESRLLEQIKQDEEKLVRQEKEAVQAIAQYETEIENLRQVIAEMRSDKESELHSELRVYQEQYMALDEKRSNGRSALGEVAQKVSRARNLLDEARSALSDSKLNSQKTELDYSNLLERIEEQFGPEYLEQIKTESNQDMLLDPEQRPEMKEKASKIRARIVREGDVDPTSIERLEEEEERLNSLQTQREDLAEAAKTLDRTIATLTETSVSRFMQTFEAVQANFADLVPRLFGGGKGSIALIDPDNPLETGVEIIARPPGKKLKSIELLSGGEKALCATALVFAMFKERPSPLCVLDEVDAPLDEANLMRFIKLVKEMSTRTQFIMITHNKGSMALSDKLVGVTMPQPGASQIISVSLQEAYEQVA